MTSPKPRIFSSKKTIRPLFKEIFFTDLNVPEWIEQSKPNTFKKFEILPLFLKEPET